MIKRWLNKLQFLWQKWHEKDMELKQFYQQYIKEHKMPEGQNSDNFSLEDDIKPIAQNTIQANTPEEQSKFKELELKAKPISVLEKAPEVSIPVPIQSEKPMVVDLGSQLKPEPTELEKVISNLEGHVSGLEDKLNMVKSIASKLAPTKFKELELKAKPIENIAEGIIDRVTKIAETIGNYVTDIETVGSFIKKQI